MRSFSRFRRFSSHSLLFFAVVVISSGLAGCGANSGKTTTVAGDSVQGYSGDSGDATGAELNFPRKVAVNSAGDMFIADTGNHVIRKVRESDGEIFTLAGSSKTVESTDTIVGVAGYSGDGGAATVATLNSPHGIALDSSGNVYISDTNNNVIRVFTSSTGLISTVPATQGGTALKKPQGLAVDPSGNIFIADTGNNMVREVTSGGSLIVIAGTGAGGYSGDGSAAASAQLQTPTDVAVDSSGNVFIADSGNHVIRKVSSAGTISTVAGNGKSGYTGDGGTATSAQLDGPQGVTVDSSGNLYIADYGNNVVRKVSSSGTISTVAGNGTPGYSGNGGEAADANLVTPSGVALDGSGNLYIADSGNNVIREVEP